MVISCIIYVFIDRYSHTLMILSNIMSFYIAFIIHGVTHCEYYTSYAKQ